MRQEALMTLNSETPDQHLLRALRITSTARFLASKRLRHHETWSLWAVTFASTVVLISSLLEPFGICPQLPKNIVAISQAIGSIVILLISMFVNGNKFGERAEKMHACAIALNALTRRVESAIHENKEPGVTDEARREYENILAQHENHNDTDFLIAKIHRASKYYGINWFDRLRAKIEYYSGFLLYSLLFLLGAWFIYMLLRPAGLACA
jgi:hypothetical protein